ncbi:hypothetical protein ABH930_001565 [Kitasatospora sp. GAS204A]|nr:hypothetical protein [Kitasatospora sp. GAS204B]
MWWRGFTVAFSCLLVAATAPYARPAAADAADAPRPPQTVVEPLVTGDPCMIQSRVRPHGQQGDFELVVLQGNDLVFYSHDNADVNYAWTRGPVITDRATGPGCLIESDYTTAGLPNLEVVVPESGRLVHYWRAGTGGPWHQGATFGSGISDDRPAIVQSDFQSDGHGHLEVLARQGDQLAAYWRDTSSWHPAATFASAVSGGPAMIQGGFGGDHKNFEVVVPVGGHLEHWWHDNSDVNKPWQPGGSFASGVTGSPSLIESGFGAGDRPGNFEVVVPVGDHLEHWWHDNSDVNKPWQPGGSFAPGVTGSPSLIESGFGAGDRPGNFEVVVPGPAAPEPPDDAQVAGGFSGNELQHWWHDNSDVNKPWQPGSQQIAYRGRSEKVCQLTGNVDSEQHTFTTNLTGLRANVQGTDLGYPVDDGSTLTLLFGDTHPAAIDDDKESGYDDAVATSQDTTPPSYASCLHLTYPIMKTFPTPTYRPAIVVNPSIYQGYFNVPSSGFVSGGHQYVIFWTNHCAGTGSSDPSHCEDGHQPGVNQYGNAVMTRYDPVLGLYKNLFQLNSRFTYTGALNTENIAAAPTPDPRGTYIWGVGLYRSTDPIMAYAPPGPVTTDLNWRYLHITPNGARSWVSDVKLASDMFTDSPQQDKCVGESSISWVAPLKSWLMLYNCAGKIQARLADSIAGPWSAPSTIFDPQADNGLCHFMHETQRDCDPVADGGWRGDPYAPYVLSRFTRADPADPYAADIDYVMSTWDPYQTVIMHTVITKGHPNN